MPRLFLNIAGEETQKQVNLSLERDEDGDVWLRIDGVRVAYLSENEDGKLEMFRVRISSTTEVSDIIERTEDGELKVV